MNKIAQIIYEEICDEAGIIENKKHFWDDYAKKKYRVLAEKISNRLEPIVKNFFACISDDTDHNLYPLLQAELRKVLQDVMLEYYKDGRYVYNIDHFHLPNTQSKRLIEFLKEKSKKNF